jgi:hypothetical protein
VPKWQNFMTMTPWRTYQTGYPRHSEALERLARHRATKLGYCVRKYNGFTLLRGSAVVLSAASIEAVLEFIDREMRMKKANISIVPDNKEKK